MSVHSADRKVKGRWFNRGFKRGELSIRASVIDSKNLRRKDTRVVIGIGPDAAVYLTGAQALHLADGLVDAIEEAHDAAAG
ncbi:hypothetical protein [Corynebacterium nuruki]|uniref:hypothetical protein n=1 Tax=Corynebacterium nuruki TaxID=1032851 RepID=UPI0039BF0512